MLRDAVEELGALFLQLHPALAGSVADMGEKSILVEMEAFYKLLLIDVAQRGRLADGAEEIISGNGENSTWLYGLERKLAGSGSVQAVKGGHARAFGKELKSDVAAVA